MYGEGGIFDEISENYVHAVNQHQGGMGGHGEDQDTWVTAQEDTWEADHQAFHESFDPRNVAVVMAIQEEMEKEGLMHSDGAHGFSFYDANEEKYITSQLCVP